MQQTVLVYLPTTVDPLRFSSTFPYLPVFVVHIIFRVYIHSLSLYASIIHIIVLCQQLSHFLRALHRQTLPPPSSIRVRFKVYFILHIIVFLLFSFIDIGADEPYYPARIPDFFGSFQLSLHGHNFPNHPHKGPLVPF